MKGQVLGRTGLHTGEAAVRQDGMDSDSQDEIRIHKEARNTTVGLER